MDYILLDAAAASLLSACMTHDDEAMITSDHLPQSITLDLSPQPKEPDPVKHKKID